MRLFLILMLFFMPLCSLSAIDRQDPLFIQDMTIYTNIFEKKFKGVDQKIYKRRIENVFQCTESILMMAYLNYKKGNLKEMQHCFLDLDNFIENNIQGLY